MHLAASPVAPNSESKSHRIFCFLHAEHALTFLEICGTRGRLLIVVFKLVIAATEDVNGLSTVDDSSVEETASLLKFELSSSS